MVRDLVLMTGFVVVVAEHGDCRYAERRELARQEPCFVGEARVGEIAREEQHVRRLRDLAEQCLKCTVRRPGAVQVADGGDADDGLRLRRGCGGRGGARLITGGHGTGAPPPFSESAIPGPAPFSRAYLPSTENASSTFPGVPPAVG